MSLQKPFNTAQARLWVRFTLLGLVAFVWLAMPSSASASCGYYVVIGHPSSQTAEQARMRHEQLPLEQNKTPCNGPQCRGQDRPMTPVQVTVAVQDPILLAVKFGDSDETGLKSAFIEDNSFLSDPHIWRSDPPPRF